MYKLIRPLLFCLPPELAHHLALKGLQLSHQLGCNRLILGNSQRPQVPEKNISLMGLTFANRVGLAAGLDKNGAYIDALADLGFGFIEVGTVTPKAQAGNPKPRVFRLIKNKALINRMGFNNEGLESFLKNVRQSQFRNRAGILGINIGKNASTAMEQASDDYVKGLEAVYSFADYVTINISSPNTKNLRELQSTATLQKLLFTLSQTRLKLNEQYGKKTPLLVKIAPDLETKQAQELTEVLLMHHIDGVIVSNTTLSREGLINETSITEAGGLSGAPVRDLSNQLIQTIKKEAGESLVIIGVGGIMQAADAQSKIQSGANLVQLYTGLMYEGPGLVKECIQAINESQ